MSTPTSSIALQIPHPIQTHSEQGDHDDDDHADELDDSYDDTGDDHHDHADEAYDAADDDHDDDSYDDLMMMKMMTKLQLGHEVIH